MIIPTIGRKVWYKPTEAEQEAFQQHSADQLFDATVVYVHFDGNVNLRVHDHAANPFFREDVVLHQGDVSDVEEGQCCWMPYQRKQAGV